MVSGDFIQQRFFRLDLKLCDETIFQADRFVLCARVITGCENSVLIYQTTLAEMMHKTSTQVFPIFTSTKLLYISVCQPLAETFIQVYH